MEFDSPWLGFSQLLQVTKKKKIVFWGCHDWFEKTTKMSKFDIEYIVDSSKNQQGLSAHHGYDVLDPEVLKTIEDKSKVFVIITSTAFYEIIKRLKEYGFKPGTSFAVTPLLKNFKIIEDIITHEQNILLSSSDALENSETEGGGIYTYHTPSCKMEKKLSGVTRGFVKYKDNYFVVDALEGVWILDKDFGKLDSFELPKQSTPHGIEIDEENKLIYIVLSTRDEIGVYEMNSFKKVRSIFLTDKFKRTGLYNHHMNDICLDGDSLYISMFSKTGNLQKFCLDGGIVEYNLQADEVLGSVVEKLWQPHSVRIIDGNLCYLDSMRGNLHTSIHKVETHINGFARGLDYDGKYYYIGQSLHRYFDRMEGYSNNIAMDCGFFMFDSSSKACKFFPTPTLKNINTLKIYDSCN